MIRPFCLRYLTATTVLLLSAILPTLARESVSSPTAQASESESALEQSGGLTPATNPNISFRKPLRVTSVRIPNSWQFRRSDYLFTLDFPAEAVEPLEKIVFEQIEGVDYPRYDEGDSYAFDAGSRNRFALSGVESDRDQRTITVKFDPPVQPGSELIVALNARNPRGGIYIYRLSAFPVGASEGQYAGIQRLDFLEPSRRRRFGLF